MERRTPPASNPGHWPLANDEVVRRPGSSRGPATPSSVRVPMKLVKSHPRQVRLWFHGGSVPVNQVTCALESSGTSGCARQAKMNSAVRRCLSRAVLLVRNHKADVGTH
jgi:hypothetical protein